jgi:hypothetical protein
MDNDKLNCILEKVEENNKILRKMRRASIWGNIFRVFYWGLIIVSAIGAYWFIQPLLSTYSELLNSISNVKNTTSKIPSSISDLLK